MHGRQKQEPYNARPMDTQSEGKPGSKDIPSSGKAIEPRVSGLHDEERGRRKRCWEVEEKNINLPEGHSRRSTTVWSRRTPDAPERTAPKVERHNPEAVAEKGKRNRRALKIHPICALSLKYSSPRERRRAEPAVVYLSNTRIRQKKRSYPNGKRECNAR